VNREKENERRKDEEPLLILEPGKTWILRAKSLESGIIDLRPKER